MSSESDLLSEVIKIRELLEPAPKPAPEKPKNFWVEFKGFLSKYKVMGLAVAFILGLYLKDLISALVDDLIMPMIEPIMPDIASWETYVIGPFRIGHFTGELISFIIVAFVIFILVKITTRYGIE